MKFSGSPTADFLNGKPKKVTIKLGDSTSIAKSMDLLNKTVDDIKQAMYDEVERICQVGEDEAKAKVHVDSGELRDSITHKVKKSKKKIKGVVSAGTDHAMFQEFGTGLVGKDSNYPGDTSGWVYDYKNQDWKGHKSNHFMYDAAKKMEEEMRK
ncbi:MAG: HK97 gp10 family phage protein [Paludibacteraceae bacterium]|nr:HK97 gp10 family phage protein [Paludibacteraceae bacterium]